ncbi:uncharacterized protein HMPREF1541_00203 [Cyphellophora europaea CBS 101466]|uniref:T6SS Phospholipase effector Tle1-like catalytic domain-containing protein n=1 Tax=Cyphellophora europaea (strain CBS 101466) TaxID=1220924 RepID=W2SBN3_CYPE1|nr:uncharacterized protein HMPREF1541_00203 [Cyphellophora europaea CBS 101466]ETN46020.1 hypothetical protein HMPREF1541_00203 [Cyphellophora europaea CBS 101466]
MSTASAGRKRIIVCCDGTWMDSDGQYQIPSNVTRIARAIKPVGVDQNGDSIPQIIFYQNGVGTGSRSLWVKYVGGATGEGLGTNIREAYSFICQNYNDGDEIFIIGFSRGAFTARSISSLIRAIGLLTSTGLENFDSIFEDWQNQLKPDWRTKYPDYPWPGHVPPVDAPEYQRKMLELELTRPDIPVKAVAVWDTVGGLGIPMIGLLPQPPSTDFSFVNTRVEPNIEYAFQALALDEHRRAYSPTIWEKPAGQALPKKLKQTWFPGVHSDVGGSYPDTDLANLTLCWMVSQLDPFIDFEANYVWKQVRLSIESHEKTVARLRKDNPNAQMPSRRPWGLGKIHNSMSFFFRLGGSKIRTPGEYTESERADQHGTLWWMTDKIATRLLSHPKPKPRLVNTNESFHSSVRIRMGKRGKGYDDKGFYDSDALQGWVMSGDMADPDTPHQRSLPGPAGAMKNVVWHKRVTRRNDKGEEEDIETLNMPEDPMGDFERTILQLWPEISESFDCITPGGHGQDIKKRALTYPPAGNAATPPPPPVPGVPMLKADGVPPSRRRSLDPRQRDRKSVASDDASASSLAKEDEEDVGGGQPERAETY